VPVRVTVWVGARLGVRVAVSAKVAVWCGSGDGELASGRRQAPRRRQRPRDDFAIALTPACVTIPSASVCVNVDDSADVRA
jgi:hypothetical protein